MHAIIKVFYCLIEVKNYKKIVEVPNLLTLRNNDCTGGFNKRGREVAQIGSRPILPLEINQVLHL